MGILDPIHLRWVSFFIPLLPCSPTSVVKLTYLLYPPKTSVMTILSIIVVPETYAPTILRRRARSLQAAALSEGKEEYYIAKYDTVKKSKREVVLVGLCRPFEMLFTEVIVGCLSIYGALIYGM